MRKIREKHSGDNMSHITSASGLTDILSLLQDDPHLLGLSSKRIDIAVKFSNTRKRFTDFHRLEVTDGQGESHLFWLRTIKNKPAEVATKSLRKQHRALTELTQCLGSMSLPNLQLSCCEPIVLLAQHSSIITKECRGELLNRYLVKCIPPLLRRRDLIRTFGQVGIWLKVFHTGFREELSAEEHDERIRQFERKFGQPLREDLSYATLCHFDYSPRNIFVGRNCVEVIDLVGAGPGIAQADVEFFCNYVRKARFNGLYSRSMKKKLVGAFLDAYLKFEAPEPSAERKQLPADAATEA